LVVCIIFINDAWSNKYQTETATQCKNSTANHHLFWRVIAWFPL